jgi:CRP/FNR family cyclic AMP-dependent transcriptional regulator
LAPAPLTPHIDNVEEFLSHCHRRRYPAKSTIIYAGDQGDALHHIIKGTVTVVIEDANNRK